MSRLMLTGFATMLMMVCITSAAMAQQESEFITSDTAMTEPVAPRLPLWEAGVFGAGYTQPAYPGAEERSNLLLGLPFAIYRGKYLRVDRGTVGVRAIKTPRTEVDIGFAASLGSRADNIEARHGMDDLGTLLEFGPRLKVNLGEVVEGESDSHIQFAARVVMDANDHLNYRGIAFEPQWVKDMRLENGWNTSLNLGAVFGDQKLVDTFYRVAPSEATSTRPSYDARSGLITLRASLFASRLINPDVRFLATCALTRLQGQPTTIVRWCAAITAGLPV